MLPFANLSGNPENTYFAAGIQDEHHHAARRSRAIESDLVSFDAAFQELSDDLPAIASQLGVANILQGSVQRSADQVRVNVQLVKAETDTHLWADTFDRKLTDVFPNRKRHCENNR